MDSTVSRVTIAVKYEGVILNGEPSNMDLGNILMCFYFALTIVKTEEVINNKRDTVTNSKIQIPSKPPTSHSTKALTKRNSVSEYKETPSKILKMHHGFSVWHQIYFSKTKYRTAHITTEPSSTICTESPESTYTVFPTQTTIQNSTFSTRDAHVNHTTSSLLETNNNQTELAISFTSEESTGVCYQIKPPTSGLCPEGFSDFMTNTCYIIKKNQAFPPSCPYPHFLPYHETKNATAQYFYNTTIWVNAFRNTTSGFPDFEWFENGFHYKQPVKENTANNDDVNTNCLITRGGKLFRASCSEKHSTLCVYSSSRLLNSFESSMCPREEYNQCILADYNLLNPTCFCLKTKWRKFKKRKFCDKLAEPIHAFQSQLISKAFHDDTCWIGLYKNESRFGTYYKWPSINSRVNYTSWATPNNCQHNEGAFQFSPKPMGWTLAKDKTLNCAICEIKPTLPAPTLNLRRTFCGHTIKLLITNPNSITNYYGNRSDVYCFSDYSKASFKERVDYRSHDGEVKLFVVPDIPSYYWCEAFHYTSFRVVRSNAVIWFTRVNGYGHEFSIYVRMGVRQKSDPFKDVYVQICRVIEEQIVAHYDILQSLRPMRANLDETQQTVKLVIHVTTKKTSDSALVEFGKLKQVNKSISFEDPSIRITDIFNSEVCLEINSLTDDEELLEWPETRIGATAIPSNRLCLDEKQDMLPVTRRCNGDFLYGGTWGEVEGTCYKNTTYAKETQNLFDLRKLSASAEVIAQDLIQIMEETSDKQLIDVYLIATLLEKLINMQGERVKTQTYITIINNMMKYNRDTLNAAQTLLNSTDKMLASLDDFLKHEKSTTIISSNLIVYIADLQHTDSVGVTFFSSPTVGDNFEQYTVRPIFRNFSSINLVTDKNLETAIVFPLDVTNQTNRPIRLIATLFYNDLLFNQQNNIKSNQATKRLKSKVTGILIPGLEDSLDLPVRIIFKLHKKYTHTKSCSYWNYGLSTLMTSVYGRWEIDAQSKKISDNLEVCEFFHMTHFGILLNGDSIADIHDRPLEIITAVGSALSLIGIIPIFITGIFIKRWRNRPRNIILLNFCLAITIQIIFTFLIYAVKSDGIFCKIVGAGLHYTILSEFCWMFVTAMLQYRRVVVVFNTKEIDVLRRGFFIGWCVPIFPVIVTIIISVDNYEFNTHNFCYLTGRYLRYALKLPLILILGVNAVIFIIIMYTVSQLKVATDIGRNHKHKLEILLAVLLFFVLGISWLFGLTGALGGGVLFTYIFCISATLRGLVLFLFFIAGNRETRLMWKKYSKLHLKEKVQELKEKHHQLP